MAEPTTTVTDLFDNNTVEIELEDQGLSGIGITTASYIAICIFGLIGNLIIIIVLFADRKGRSPSTIFILNLAITDFIFLLSLPLMIKSMLVNGWLYGHALCKLQLGVLSLTVFSSANTLVLMSWDRFIAVCMNKWRSYRSVRNSAIMCACGWGLSILLSLPILLYTKVDEEYLTCDIEWSHEKNTASPHIYLIYSLSLGFVIPVVLITVFYSLILTRLTRAGLVRNSQAKKKRTRKVTFLVLAIILAFVICWLPYWVLQVISLSVSEEWFDPEERYKAFVTALNFATIMYHFNSAINPLLYGFTSESFRKTMLQVFGCKGKMEPRNSRHSTWLHFFGKWKDSRKSKRDTVHSCSYRSVDQATEVKGTSYAGGESYSVEEGICTNKALVNGMTSQQTNM